MKTAVATRFCCRSPLTDLTQLTLMFLTLILQYLNKLIEGEVGDLASPKSFHTRKVQGFNGDGVESLTKFRSKLPLKIFALVADFPIETCELSHTPPPTVRTFLFAAQCFVERPKFLQGLFQRLWVLFFLTRVQRQICVFHTEVCPNALTCCRQRFKICVGCCDVKPIVSATVTFDCDTTESPVPLAVLMKSVRNFIKTPFACLRIPFTESQCDTIVFQRPPRTSRVCYRFELVSGFPFRFPTQFFEKTIVGKMYPSQFLLNRLAWQGIPMRVCGAFQIGHVCRHGMIVRIGQSISIPFVLPSMEIVMHLPHIVKQIPNTDTIRLIAKLILIRFHRLSSIKRLSPTTWEETSTLPSGNASYAGLQLDTSIKPHFTKNVKCFSKNALVLSKRAASTSPE